MENETSEEADMPNDDTVPDWLRERRKSAAEALRQADRRSSKLFEYMWDRDEDV